MPESEHENHDHASDEAVEQTNAAGSTGGAGPQQPEEAGSEALADALRVSFRFLKWAMVFLVLVFLLTGIFTVQPEEVKFRLRFGELVSRAGNPVLRPGSWHLRWPWEEVVTVATDEKTLTLEDEFWAKAEQGNDVRQARFLSVRNDGYLLSGDANIVHMKLRLRYRARSDSDGAVAYAFLVQNPEETLRREFKASVVKVVGSMPVMDVINRKGLIEAIMTDLQARLKRFEESGRVPLGLSVIAVETIEEENIKNPTEPGSVRSAFFEAQNAISFRNALVSEGQTEAETIVNNAEARRAEILAEANGYATRLVRSARADAAQLQQLLPVYENSAAEANLLLEDFYQRAMVDVMKESPGAFVLHRQPEGARSELRLMFSRTPVVETKKEETDQGSASR